MEANQAASPDKDNSPAAEAPGQEGSVLTGKAQSAAASAPSAGEAAPKAAPAWMAQLPEDLKSNEGLTKFTTIGELGKSYLELQGKMGKAVVLPGEGAPAEEWARYRKAVGVPDNPTDYKLDKVEFTERVKYGDEAQEEFRTLAHKMHLSQEQANLMHTWHLKSLVGSLVASLKEVKATDQETTRNLQERWGGDYSLKREHMVRGFDWFAEKASPEMAQKFTRSGLGNDIEVIEAFARLGAALGEHGFRAGSAEKQPTGSVDPAKVLYPNQN